MLEDHLELLQSTFDQARETGTLEIILHVNTLEQMYEYWPGSVRIRWRSETPGVLPMEQPKLFKWYIEKCCLCWLCRRWWWSGREQLEL